MEFIIKNTFNLPTPNEGIYDISNELYHASAGFSSSKVKELSKSISHYKAATSMEVSESMQIGTAVHMGILEPHLFDKKVFRGPQADARSKDGICEMIDFYCKVGEIENGVLSAMGMPALREHLLIAKNQLTDQIILKNDDYLRVLAMIESIKCHPLYSDLLQDEGGFAELSFFSKNEALDSICKCRPDFLIPGRNILIDIKTTVDPSPQGFRKQIANFNYHLSAAFYIDVLAKHDIQINQYYFIVVGNQQPHITEIYQLDEVSIEEGRFKANNALLRYQQWLENKEIYQGYTDGKVYDISLPKWAFEHTTF